MGGEMGAHMVVEMVPDFPSRNQRRDRTAPRDVVGAATETSWDMVTNSHPHFIS
jgi:hypothetical protein